MYIEQEYEYGFLHGRTRSWRKGILYEDVMWCMGYQHGAQSLWGESGDFLSRKIFQWDRQCGPHFEMSTEHIGTERPVNFIDIFTEDAPHEIMWEHGNPISLKIFYENGNVHFKGPVFHKSDGTSSHNLHKSGLWKEWDMKGVLVEEKYYSTTKAVRKTSYSTWKGIPGSDGCVELVYDKYSEDPDNPEPWVKMPRHVFDRLISKAGVNMS